MKWRNIETAPKDGSYLLLGWWQEWPERRWVIQVAPAGNIDVARPGRGYLHSQATHWMPTPEPPKEYR